METSVSETQSPSPITRRDFFRSSSECLRRIIESPLPQDREKEQFEPPEIFKETVNGVEILFVGIYHSPDYLKRYRNELVEIIPEKSLVVPEIFPFESKQIDFFDFIERYPILRKIFAYELSTKEFFLEIANISSEKSGKIAVVDPEVMWDVSLIEGGLTYLGLYSLISFVKDFLNYARRKRKMTRKEFVKTGVKGVATYSLLATEPPSGFFEALIGRFENAARRLGNHGIDDTLAYSAMNYRNICVAEGLDKLTKSFGEAIDGPIAVIYGKFHIHPIATYLKTHQKERKIKRELYIPIFLLGDEAVRHYEFINGKWIFKGKEDY